MDARLSLMSQYMLLNRPLCLCGGSSPAWAWALFHTLRWQSILGLLELLQGVY